MARYIGLFLLAACGMSVAFVGQLPTSLRPTALRAMRGEEEVSAAQDEAKGAQSSQLRIGSAMLSVLAAIAFALLPVQEAQAARSGGRIGGSASAVRRAPRPAPPKAAVASSNTTVINKTTVVAPPPVVAPPMMAPPVGFGMGYAPAVVVAPPPTVGDVIVGSMVGGAINNAMYHHNGPSSADRMLENQQRQDERQMDNQQREIEQLKAELNSLKVQK
mmetsp:Transcript_7/g.16  ORF Transcript_7/g.16 Transcript_7/m.16 type:complete len:218 (+) Transcript_7:66-719(+)